MGLMIEAATNRRRPGIPAAEIWGQRKATIDEWRRELLRLEGEGARDPENSQVAYRRWRQMRSYDGQCDYRSINTALYVFRKPALSQPEGAVMLASAIREVVEERGEEPRKEWFGCDLLAVLKRAIKVVKRDGKQEISWLLKRLDRTAREC